MPGLVELLWVRSEQSKVPKGLPTFLPPHLPSRSSHSCHTAHTRPCASMWPSRRACVALLWVAAGLCCLSAAEPRTLAFHLLAEDPSAFDVLAQPDWHARLEEEVGDDLGVYMERKPAFETEPACDWCLEELMVRSRAGAARCRRLSCSEGAGGAQAASPEGLPAPCRHPALTVCACWMPAVPHEGPGHHCRVCQ